VQTGRQETMERLAAARSRLPEDMQDHCADPDDLALLRQWDQLQSGFRRLSARLLDDVEGQAGITHSTFQVLWYLMSCEDFTARMNQLSQTLGFSTAGTTKVADRMADAGLIERAPSTADRRVILVTLTDEGLRVSALAIRAFIAALKERAVDPLGAGGFEALIAAVAGIDPGGAAVQCPGGAGDGEY
jgi:DNA-binding MarR family transcriptional regulator